MNGLDDTSLARGRSAESGRSARTRQARIGMFAVLFLALAIAMIGMLVGRGQSY
jgi:hypothetical protein